MMSESKRFHNPDGRSSGLTRKARLVVCLAILAVGVAVAVYIQKTKPKAKKKPPVKMATLVTARKVFPGQHRMLVTAMGTVVPALETVLKSRVAGEVIAVHPEYIEGGFIPKDEEIVRLDSKDYQLQVAKSVSAVVGAEYALRLEMGHQEVARREWDLIQKEQQPMDLQDMELALRKPHLDKAEADLAAAKAQLAEAKLNLDRTVIRSPYNAIVRTKRVDIGSQVAAQEQLAEIMGVDEYRVQVAMPTDKLQYITFPKQGSENGSPARILYRNGSARSGTVLKLLGDLETEGRMARILVSVPDPQGLLMPENTEPPLLIGEYVRVEIQGPLMDGVYQIANSTLHDNRSIWVAGKDETLEVRSVQVLWRTRDAVFINSGLRPGDQLIHSGIPVPVDGMKLKVELLSDN